MTKSIDREQICKQTEAFNENLTIIKLNETLLNEAPKKRSLAYSNHMSVSDSINCECKREKCELRLRFLAFQEKLPRSNRHQFNQTKQTRNSPSLFNFQYHHRHQRLHKSLILTIDIKDLNDNFPIFKKNFFYLNISEQIGTQQNIKEVTNKSGDIACSHSSKPSSDISEQFPNTLIPLEQAFDSDVGKNAEIVYKLVLLENSTLNFVEAIEATSSESEREHLIQSALAGKVKNCKHMFELVETQTNTNDEYKDSTNNLKNLLFLKVNTFLDREQQDVYNFILIANEKNKPRNTSEYFIHGTNYMLIRLVVADLNDNSPVFSQFKYTFKVNEVTEYSNNQKSTDESEYYFEILNHTCQYLKHELQIKATDKDLHLNGLIKYKLIQQVHQKNPNFKHNLNKILNKVASNEENPGFRFMSSNLDSSSLFSIDENEGAIWLTVCYGLEELKHDEPSLSRKRFLELTSLLDYELYSKHIFVVEASDTSMYNPLQTFVTVELNLLDLNDHTPYMVSLYSKKCAKLSDFQSHEYTNHSASFVHSSFISSIEKNGSDRSEINVLIENLDVQDEQLRRQVKLSDEDEFIGNMSFLSSKIIITGLSESSRSGACIGQFLISDLDTKKENQRLQTILVEHPAGTNILLNNNYQIDPTVRLERTNKFVFRNLNNRMKSRYANAAVNGSHSSENSRSHEDEQQEYVATSTNEIYELFLNFEPDFETKRTYEFILIIRDYGQVVSFASYTQFIVIFKVNISILF